MKHEGRVSLKGLIWEVLICYILVISLFTKSFLISDMTSVPLSTRWSSLWHFSVFIFHFQTKMHCIHEDEWPLKTGGMCSIYNCKCTLPLLSCFTLLVTPLLVLMGFAVQQKKGIICVTCRKLPARTRYNLIDTESYNLSGSESRFRCPLLHVELTRPYITWWSRHAGFQIGHFDVHCPQNQNKKMYLHMMQAVTWSQVSSLVCPHIISGGYITETNPKFQENVAQKHDYTH